jgi:hypothetical protein
MELLLVGASDTALEGRPNDCRSYEGLRGTELRRRTSPGGMSILCNAILRRSAARRYASPAFGA